MNYSICDKLPKMLSREELFDKQLSLPDYDDSIKEKDVTTRLLKLHDIFNIYIPTDMSYEIYSRLYVSLLRSLRKKEDISLVKKRNMDCVSQIEAAGISSIDCMLFSGRSGIGKSAAVYKAVREISNLISNDNPHTKIIPCLIVQTPFDCSVKSLLLEIVRKVDEVLGTEYYPLSVPTTDVLIGTVSKVLINHVGILIVDEIQNILKSRLGQNLVGCLTQLINNAGISLVFIGTPESNIFFEGVDYLSRRTLGLRYYEYENDDIFAEICKILWNFQYTKEACELDEALVEWIYEHTAGVIANVLTLIVGAQELSLLSGRDYLDKTALIDAYSNRMQMMHTHINDKRKTRTRTKKVITNIQKYEEIQVKEEVNIFEIIMDSKRNDSNVIDVLREVIAIEEVAI